MSQQMLRIDTAVATALLLACLAPAAYAQCVTQPAGMTGWWQGENATTDIVGGRDAILNNGATYGAGQVGQAFEFDGVDDDVSVAHDAALDVGTGDFTVEFWVMPSLDGGEETMVEKWDEDIDTGWTICDRGGLFFAATGSSIQTSTDIVANVWTHIALRRSGSTVALFHNGSLIDSASDSTNYNNTVPLIFGRRRGDQGFFWHGRIDEIHYLVGTALSNAQIQAIYDAGSDGMCSNDCGNTMIDGSEECDDGNPVNGDGCDNNCTISVCGNGVPADPEACDDGNAVNGDGCDNDCTISCGNTVITPPEICDDGNVLDGDGCDSDCTPTAPCAPIPVDLTAWWPGDGGSADIQGGYNAVARNGAGYAVGRSRLAFNLDGSNDFIDVPDDPGIDVGAGDFTVDLWARFNDTAGEQVLIEKWVQAFNDSDSGWTLTKLDDNKLRLATPFENADSRRLTLPNDTWIHFAARRSGGTLTVFVNGEDVASAEIAGDLTSPSSLKFGHRGSLFDTPGSLDTRGFFLNGRIDEVHLVVGRGMSNAEIEAIHDAGAAGFCVPPATCGNGVIEAGEPCDDGNGVSGDGCENDCTPSCGNGVPDAGEGCDDGNPVDGDGCDTNCSVSACGNGVIGGSEDCEDGNAVNGDGCDNNCSETSCGNGIVTSDETCDDGNLVNGDGCEDDCTITTVEETVPPGGTVTTDPGTGATPQAPIQVSMTTPDGGMVSIASADEPLTPASVKALVDSLLIEAPPATALDPLSISIRIDASVIPPGLDLLHMTLTRDGVVLENCSGAPGTASPDPCIESRVLEGDGDVTITGLSSHASVWGAVARGLVTSEQKCVNSAAKAGTGVAKAQGGLNAGCLKQAASGETADPEGCLVADADGKVDNSKQKTIDTAADRCTALPPFGFTDAATINTAAQAAALLLMTDLFGNDLNGAVATDDAGADCQAAALKGTQKLFAFNTALFLSCQKSGLAGDPTPMVSLDELATCFDALTIDAKRLKSTSKLGKSIASKCEGDIAALLPGTCGMTLNPSYCIATRVSCRTCQLINGATGLGRDCDLYDDFMANGSCI